MFPFYPLILKNYIAYNRMQLKVDKLEFDQEWLRLAEYFISDYFFKQDLLSCIISTVIMAEVYH